MTPKVFIAVPVYGSVPDQFLDSMMRLMVEPPKTCSIEVKRLAGDSLVSRARNTLTALFLKSDCTHLLFVDSDLVFSGEQIDRLVSHNEPVVAGFYPKKNPGPLEWVCNAKPGEGVDSRGLQSVRYMGTGFLMVKREVFDRMIGALGKEISFHPDDAPEDTQWDFWSVGVCQTHDGLRRYLSEDWFFCERALNLGYKIYGDTRVILKHVGQGVYPLPHQDVELRKQSKAARRKKKAKHANNV